MNTNPIQYQGTTAVRLDSQNRDPEHIAQQRQLRRAVNAINKAEVYGQRSELTLSIDQETRHPLLRVVDRETKQVLLQIPAESALRMAQDLPNP